MFIAAAACAPTPTPGNLAIFCSLLEGGSGLSAAPTAPDLEDLVAVAPPEIRPTIEALQSRNRDLGDLLAETPRDLEAIFDARFDPAARVERAALDDYASNSCGLAVDRPPATRWTTWVNQNHEGAAWRAGTNVQFEVVGDQVAAMTIIFESEPDPQTLLEEACAAARSFLQTENGSSGRVQVLVGTVAVIDLPDLVTECRLP